MACYNQQALLKWNKLINDAYYYFFGKLYNNWKYSKFSVQSSNAREIPNDHYALFISQRMTVAIDRH